MLTDYVRPSVRLSVRLSVLPHGPGSLVLFLSFSILSCRDTPIPRIEIERYIIIPYGTERSERSKRSERSDVSYDGVAKNKHLTDI